MTKVYTDGGRRDVGGVFHAGYGIAMYHEDGSIETHQKPLQEKSSNYAEIVAVLDVFKIMLDRKLNKVNIYSDSSYTVDGINKYLKNWSTNGWLTKNLKQIKNLELWKEMHEIKIKLLEANLRYKVTWVRSHSDTDKSADFSEGNVLADKLATLALYRSSRELETLIEIRTETEKVADDKKKLVANNINGLINAKRLYFRAGATSVTAPGRYFTCKFPDKELDEKKRPMEGKFFGCPVPDSFVAISQLVEPEEDIELIIAEQNKVCAAYSDNEYPCLLWLDKITEKKTYNELLEHKEKALTPNSLSLFLWGRERLTRIMHTAYMAFNGANHFKAGNVILNKMMKGESLTDDGFLVDITDKCFEVTEKGKVLPIIKAGCKSIEFGFKMPGKDKDYKCILTPDIDLPTPINIGRIAKQNKEVKVQAYIHDVAANTYRVFVIFETTTGMSVMYSPDSSHRIYI